MARKGPRPAVRDRAAAGRGLAGHRLGCGRAARARQDPDGDLRGICPEARSPPPRAPAVELEFTVPSFSAFNRHAIKLATLSRRLDETREITGVLAEKFDAKASDDLTIIAAEAIKTLVFEVLTAAGESGVDPKGAMNLANALRRRNPGARGFRPRAVKRSRRNSLPMSARRSRPSRAPRV